MRLPFMMASVATMTLGVFASPAFANDAAAPDGEGAKGLDEIVVKAQRREESLQKVAIAVTAISGDALIAGGVTDVAGLNQFAPSLLIQPAGGSAVNLYLRGVGTLQANSFGENPIAFNYNETYIARPTSIAGTFFDLERIEVVKGPQGTLYGRNATGGAINVIPRRPSLDGFSGDAMAEYGNYNSLKTSAAINLPLGETVAVRIAGQVVDRDGYLSDGYQDEKGEAVRGSLLIKPSERFSALVVVDYFHSHGMGIGSVLVPGSSQPAGFPGYAAPRLSDRIGGSDPRSLAALNAFAAGLFAPPFCGGLGGFIRSGCVRPPRGDGFVDGRYFGLSAIIEGDIGIGTLTVIPSYRRSRNQYDGYVPGFLTRNDEIAKQYSLEVRLSSKDEGVLNYVVGAYYFNEKQDALNFFDQGDISTTRFTPQLETESAALFGHSDVFRLVAGGRYTQEDKSQLTALASGGRPFAVFPPLGAPFSGDLDFNRFTWKAGVEFDAGPRSLVYANVATGFKAGGFFVASPPNNSYAPEKLTAYTLGSKNRFFGNRLQLNIEAFYWQYRDQQISFVGGISTPGGIAPGLVTVNAGRSRMYGVDADARLSLFGGGLLSVDLQYLNGRYNSLSFSTLSASGAPVRTNCAVSNARQANPGTPNPSRLFDINCSGFPTINSPKWSANIGYQHRFAIGGDLGLILGASTRIESSRFTSIEYLPEMRAGAFMMSDAFATLEGPDKRWSLTGFINNIEDETVISGAFQRPVLQSVYATLRPPRTYGVRGTIKF